MRGVILQQPNPYLAALIESGASGYAGDAAGILIERKPDLAARYGAAAFDSWRGFLRRQLIELAGALAVGEPALFAAQLVWMRHAFAARAQPEDVDSSLDALCESLSRRLPESVRPACGRFIEHARSQLRAAPASPIETALDPAVLHDRRALVYLNRLLDGRDAAAIEGVMSLKESGLGITAVYRDVLLPAQREIGRRWHLGVATIAEEHCVTEVTRRLMARLGSAPPASPDNGRTVVAAAVAGNAHDIGMRAVADLFRHAGWRVRFLGADVPARDVSGMLAGADLLLLCATLGGQVKQVAETIRVVRAGSFGDTAIVVGGAAFDTAPGLWRRIGADGYAASIDEAVAVGERLVDA